MRLENSRGLSQLRLGSLGLRVSLEGLGFRDEGLPSSIQSGRSPVQPQMRLHLSPVEIGKLKRSLPDEIGLFDWFLPGEIRTSDWSRF